MSNLSSKPFILQTYLGFISALYELGRVEGCRGYLQNPPQLPSFGKALVALAPRLDIEYNESSLSYLILQALFTTVSSCHIFAEMKTMALVIISLCACSATALTTEITTLETSTVDCSVYAFPTSLEPVPGSGPVISSSIVTTSLATPGTAGGPSSPPVSTGGAGGDLGDGSGGGGRGGSGRGSEGEGSNGSNGASSTSGHTASGTTIVQVPTAGGEAIRPGEWVLFMIGLLMAF
ncbi:hypothetical protein Landi51_09118 [Colletotrichum acutatum]